MKANQTKQSNISRHALPNQSPPRLSPCERLYFLVLYCRQSSVFICHWGIPCKAIFPTVPPCFSSHIIFFLNLFLVKWKCIRAQLSRHWTTFGHSPLQSIQMQKATFGNAGWRAEPFLDTEQALGCVSLGTLKLRERLVVDSPSVHPSKSMSRGMFLVKFTHKQLRFL